MASTKTLAKLANYAAKKWHKTGGVLDLSDPERREKLMRLVPVNEIWGIGRQTTKECARNNFLKQPSLNNEISPLN